MPMRLSDAPHSSFPAPSAPSARLAYLAAFTYAALVLAMWLPFNPCGGMPYESHFLFNSEVWPIKGILFPSDPMRPHTSTFYHVSFLLGEALGIGGSFVPFQIVYAALWWARGFLMFLILRRMFPAEHVFAFCCGALVVVHASDHALLWVGQMNQFGFIFWMLLAFYLFVRSVQAESEKRTSWYMLGAAVAEHMSLWSYESQLLLVLCAPLALFFSDRARLLAKPRIVAAWYVLPAAYIGLSAYGYVIHVAGDYQGAVMRTDWSLPAIAHDWWFNTRVSLAFWTWDENMPWLLDPKWLTLFGLAGAAAYVVGWAGTVARPNRSNDSQLSTRAWLGILGAGLIALLLSFPAYLLLASAATLWRTQFLSGIGMALAWASLAGLAGSLLPRRWPRAWLYLVLGAVVAHFGIGEALRAAFLHDQIWARHRPAFESMLKVAPRVAERAVVVAVGVPKAEDPFGHNMWFNFGLKLAYPARRVVGIYFYDDGTAAVGNHLRLEGGKWAWDGSFENPGDEPRSISQTIVVEYESLQKARILTQLPDVLAPTEEAQTHYEPRAVIEPGSPSPRAVRRYFPCPQWWWTLSPQR